MYMKMNRICYYQQWPLGAMHTDNIVVQELLLAQGSPYSSADCCTNTDFYEQFTSWDC